MEATVVMVLTIMAFLLEDPRPTGDVSTVCWALLAATVAGAAIPLTWLNKRNDALEKKVDEKDKENDRLRDLRLEDREKIIAQTNVTLNTLMAKKRGESPQ